MIQGLLSNLLRDNFNNQLLLFYFFIDVILFPFAVVLSDYQLVVWYVLFALLSIVRGSLCH